MLAKFFSKFFSKELRELGDKVSSLTNELDKEKIRTADLSEKLNKSEYQVDETSLKLEKTEKDSLVLKKNLEQSLSALDDRTSKLAFIANVINAKHIENEAFKSYQKLLNEDYFEYANRNDCYAAEAEALIILQDVEKQLELITYDKDLLNKNVIAIAGYFSSGKSAFMNSFFLSKDIKLPTGVDQTTAISSFVTNGKEVTITGYTNNGGRIDIPEKLFALFNYKDIGAFNFNMKQIIDHIVVKTQFQKEFENICFVDTPGFNPGNEAESDFNAATNSIANANAMIWVHSCESIIQQDEMEILYDIYSKYDQLKIYIVINQADKRSLEDLESIIFQIENSLSMNGIEYEGMCLYSSNVNRNFNILHQDPDFNSFTRGMSLMEFLESCDVENEDTEKNLIQQIECVFQEYIAADNQRIEMSEKQIEVLTIIESAFGQEIEKIEGDVAYYKGRMDLKRWKETLSKSEEESDQIRNALTENIEEMKYSLVNLIKIAKRDIEIADEINFKMQQAVAGVFDHKLWVPVRSASCKPNITKSLIKENVEAKEVTE